MAKVEILVQKGYHFLWIDDVLWMWDIPQEHKDQQEMAELASGHVLVAGYGLGILQKYLCENPKVLSVVSIEAHTDVVRKAFEVYGTVYGDVVYGDFYDIDASGQFDYVIGDIWSDINKDYLDEYKKFKVHAKRIVSDETHILGWGKDYFEFLIGEGK